MKDEVKKCAIVLVIQIIDPPLLAGQGVALVSCPTPDIGLERVDTKITYLHFNKTPLYLY